MSEMKNDDGAARSAGLGKLEQFALQCLVGYLASGRKMTVENGREISIEEGAILRAKTLLTLLEKEK